MLYNKFKADVIEAGFDQLRLVGPDEETKVHVSDINITKVTVGNEIVNGCKLESMDLGEIKIIEKTFSYYHTPREVYLEVYDMGSFVVNSKKFAVFCSSWLKKMTGNSV